MALERRNPLPVGIYWIDVANSKAAALHRWRSSNKATVRVIKTREDRDLGFTWLLFEVSEPTPWADARVFGFPNIAEKGKDEEFIPAFTPSQNVLDQIADATPKAGTLASVAWAVGWGIAAIVLYDFWKGLRSKGGS